MKIEYDENDIKGVRGFVRNGGEAVMIIYGYEHSGGRSYQRFGVVSLADGSILLNLSPAIEIAKWLTENGYLPEILATVWGMQ